MATKKLLLRVGFFILLAGAIYVVTFLVLNGPAYWQRVKFAAAGNDLSKKLDGQYVSVDYLDQLDQSQTDLSQRPANKEGIAAKNKDNPVYKAGSPSLSGPTPAASAKTTYINPNIFVANTVTVPRIGVRAPLIEIPVNTQSAQQKGLEQGVIHIAGTVRAGQTGNAFYAGHSSDYLFKPGHYKTVFALLPELRKNDYFILSDDKNAYYYRINEVVITSPKDTTVLTRGNKEKKFASLQTSYPVGTALKRFVVVGELQRTIKYR